MAATYPELFAAATAYSGVPAGCFVSSSGQADAWNSTCAQGKVDATPAYWANTVKNMYAGYTGSRPRFQVYHGSIDATLLPPNYNETVKEWTGVFGYVCPSVTKGLARLSHVELSTDWLCRTTPSPRTSSRTSRSLATPPTFGVCLLRTRSAKFKASMPSTSATPSRSTETRVMMTRYPSQLVTFADSKFADMQWFGLGPYASNAGVASTAKSTAAATKTTAAVKTTVASKTSVANVAVTSGQSSDCSVQYVTLSSTGAKLSLIHI